MLAKLSTSILLTVFLVGLIALLALSLTGLKPGAEYLKTFTLVGRFVLMMTGYIVVGCGIVKAFRLAERR